MFAPMLLAGALGAAASPLGACGSSGGRGVSDGSRKDLAAYGGHAAELFDDTIEPRAVGLDVDPNGVSPKSDPILRERTQLADAVLLVSVGTVTSKLEDSGTSFMLELRTLQRLVGDHPPPETFSVTVGRRSPSAGLVKSFESRLVGKHFVVFVRAFTGSDEPELHFHVVSDSKEQLAAIREAAALAEIK